MAGITAMYRYVSGPKKINKSRKEERDTVGEYFQYNIWKGAAITDRTEKIFWIQEEFKEFIIPEGNLRGEKDLKD